ncbi:MAG: Bacterial leucyl aminopeptidase [Formosa sp. Hel1_33_131]|nr:MAG: Bacterial leucyl aminopeptidase [Formosa sp. Hel1_33_131]
MKHKSLLLILILIAYQSYGQSQNQEFYANSITADELKEKLYTYASDEFEGRETGTKGLEIAIDYLKNHYTNLEVNSAKSNGDYFQKVPLTIVDTPEVSIKVEEQLFRYYNDFISIVDAQSGRFSSKDIILVGYGIEDEKYNDYEGLDVEGKIIVAIGGEPKDENGNFIISGNDGSSKWSNGRQELRAKSRAARASGAKAFFLINEALFKRYSSYYKARDERGGESVLSLDVNEESMYAFLVNQSMGDVVLKANELSIDFKQKSQSISSDNVAAMITGSEKPDEYIILSAHLDHIGVHDGEVFNGADDDGSGTVAILEIAEAFKTAVKNGQGPKRSIIFLHVTGEEKGLLGSQYYTDYDPIVPLAQTVANLNIDMIGRTDPKRIEGKRNYIYLIGSDKLSTDLHNLSEDVNTKYTNIELDYTYNDDNDPNQFYYRSDHYNFAKNNIPVIFYFNGTHDDYHQASDTPDKIQYDLLENRTRLVFHTAWELANREEAVRVDKAIK